MRFVFGYAALSLRHFISVTTATTTSCRADQFVRDDSDIEAVTRKISPLKTRSADVSVPDGSLAPDQLYAVTVYTCSHALVFGIAGNHSRLVLHGAAGSRSSTANRRGRERDHLRTPDAGRGCFVAAGTLDLTFFAFAALALHGLVFNMASKSRTGRGYRGESRRGYGRGGSLGLG